MSFSQRILIFPLFSALLVFGQSTTSNSETSATNLPPVGLASTETAQVNVVNTAPASSTATPGTCSGSIAFYDVNGNMLGSATDFKIASGQIFSAKLPYASAESSGDSRIVIRAVITVMTVSAALGNGISPVLPLPCFLQSSLETYDTSSGVTHVFFGAAAPQPVAVVLRTGQLTPTAR